MLRQPQGTLPVYTHMSPALSAAPACVLLLLLLLFHIPAGAAERSSSAGVGCMFLAHRGAGAYVAPLSSAEAAGVAVSTGATDLTRIHVQDASDMQLARFMESFESRHSDHSFTAAVVSRGAATAPGTGDVP